MTRGPVFVPKVLGNQSKIGGAVPVANIFLPQMTAGLPIQFTANANRRVAEARPRRVA